MKEGEKFYAFEKIGSNSEYVGKAFKRTWRNWDHWAALDKAQVDAAIELTLDICRRNNIKPRFYKPSTVFDYPGCFEKATIICHSNCRKDKKDLLLQSWTWDRISASGIEIVGS